MSRIESGRLELEFEETSLRSIIDDIRNMFSDVYDFIETNCKQSRETSLAITKLEEAQFWAIKGITREEN